MSANSFNRLTVLLLVFAVSLTTYGQERDRSKIADKYKWNLTDIYPSDEAWKKAKEQLIAEMPKVERYKGKLASSASELLRVWTSTRS